MKDLSAEDLQRLKDIAAMLKRETGHDPLQFLMIVYRMGYHTGAIEALGEIKIS